MSLMKGDPAQAAIRASTGKSARSCTVTSIVPRGSPVAASVTRIRQSNAGAACGSGSGRGAKRATSAIVSSSATSRTDALMVVAIPRAICAICARSAASGSSRAAP